MPARREPRPLPGSARREHGGHVIEIVDRLRIAVADEDVLVAIVVEVGEQRAPAPIGVRDAGEAADLAEDDIAVLR